MVGDPDRTPNWLDSVPVCAAFTLNSLSSFAMIATLEAFVNCHCLVAPSQLISDNLITRCKEHVIGYSSREGIALSVLESHCKLQQFLIDLFATW
jgi:hypothetical protein